MFQYASKGTSVVLYRSKALRRFQYFTFPQWPGGLYVTPSVPGSRPGALIAACWASLIRMGEEGYLRVTKEIVETKKQMLEGIKLIPGLYVLGDPKAMIIAFDSKDFNIYSVADHMAKNGWSLNSLQHPRCVHICVTKCHIGNANLFLADLEKAVNHVKADPEAAAKEGNAPVYGMASSMPAGPVDEILCTYTDIILKV